MGTVVHTRGAFEAGSPPSVSRGSIREKRLRLKSTMGATYATGGDTVPLPTAPSGYDLDEVRITSSPALPAGITLHWDGSVATPKIVATDEDNTTGISAELASASAALAAAVLYLELVYVSGIS